MESELERERHGEPAIEIEGQDGSKIKITEGSEIVFGRGNGYRQNGLAVSRRHISFKLNSQTSPSGRVSFEVLGKNPVWVRGAKDEDVRVFRRFERGELGVGDSFCISAKDPVWFTLNRIGVGDSENWEKVAGREGDLSESLKSASSGLSADGEDLGFESVDVSNIDPVKEFGFIVIGHEFDNFPRRMIRDVKSWNWFLEDPSEESTDDADGSSDRKGKGKLRRKRKASRGADNNDDDDEWTGESGDEKEVVTRISKAQGPKYQTRSKDHCRGHDKEKGSGKWSARKQSKPEKEDEEEEDETLRGFIVDDVDEGGEGVDEVEDEEEEFEVDDDEE